jgi:hypothetical protein
MFFKGYAHPFSYPEQGLIHTALKIPMDVNDGNLSMKLRHDVTGLKEYVNASKVIHYIASIFCNPSDADISKKFVVAQHGGMTYRGNTKTLNDLYNPIVSHTIIQNPDLLGLGAKNEQWILYPVDTDMILPVYHNRPFLVIGHSPTQSETKGSLKIMQALYNFSKETRYKGQWCYNGTTDKEGKLESNAPWYSHLDKVAECDVYIEACQMTYNGLKYGAWGNAAIEAAAMGKIVITHSLYEDEYANEYGEHPMFICNSGPEIEVALDKILSMDLTETRKLQHAHRTWAVQKHGMRVTAKRIWDKVYKHYFPKRADKIKDALTHHESPKETICDTLRNIHRLIQPITDKGLIEEQLLRAMEQAKGMNDKLQDYNSRWSDWVLKDEGSDSLPPL